MLNRLKGAILFLSLFYLTFYIPMCLTFYAPGWMKLNCKWHNRCAIIGYDNAYTGMEELSAFFRHQGGLEVRGMFDKMLLIGIAAVLLLAFTYDRKKIGRFAIINAAIILSLLLVLPFFTTFWRDVFHPLLFKNNLWINNRYDLSFYIMPRQFFKYTVALLVALSVTLNVVIWLLFRKSAKKT